MWEVVAAIIIAAVPPLGPSLPERPYVSCRDGTVLPPGSQCPTYQKPDADASGGGGTGGPRRGGGGLLGLGGLGGIL